MINKNLNALKPIISEVMNNALEQTAVELNYIIEIMYGNVIDAFYNSYEPKYYKRTFSTYYGSNLYDNDNINNPSKVGNDFIAGIEVTSDNIPGHPYNRSKKDKPNKTEWVFNRTYQLGIHGTTQIEKRHWGKNNYWDKYRRIVQGKKSQYYLNQYKMRQEFGKKASKVSQSQIDRFNLELKMGAFGNGATAGNTYGRAFKKINAIVPEAINWKSGQMVGQKPKKMMESQFIKLRKSKNIDNIIFRNVFNELVRKTK